MILYTKKGILIFYQTDGHHFVIPQYVSCEVFFLEMQFYGLDHYFHGQSKSESELLFTIAIESMKKELEAQVTLDASEMKRQKLALKMRFATFDNMFKVHNVV